ncbi:thioredoxin family protein [Dactylococcopsis salina]|uniref:Thioredoxin n=1 Tax=Dactylococcopsis salina (strain PCC 8305) TaxID=13035 RepID=K9YWB2_DACS8|nr:thioredoxin domain-containing protein [Dactylococcopsis salina]AFZ50413.1 thioredoxin domain-containing protein [Dactylococcopsis salina PCC 8305]
MTETAYIQSEAELDELIANPTLLVVDCTATWCGPCKLVAPLIDQLNEAYSDRAQIRKLDLDDHKPVAKRFEVRSIPAVMFFKGGEQVETLVGAKTYDEYSTTLEKYL